MNSIALEIGGLPQHSLENGEWVFFASLCTEVGAATSVYSNFHTAGVKKLSITDVLGNCIATLTLPGGPQNGLSLTPEYGCVGSPSGIVTIPNDMPTGMFFVDGKYGAVFSRSFEPQNITIALPTTTMWMFNEFGGFNLYSSKKQKRHVFSTRRPMPRRTAEDRLFGFLAWATRRLIGINSGRVNFVGDDTLNEYLLRNTNLLVVPGRSEYWTRQSRSALDAFIERGGPVIFLSSETMYLEADKFDNGSMVGYYRYGSAFDNSRPRTGEWNDADRNYPLLPSIGPNPNDGGFLPGGDIDDKGFGVYTISSASPLFVGTGIAPGDKIQLPSVAYDGLPITGYTGEAPTLDETKIPFSRWELLGWNFGRESPQGKIGAFFAFQKNPTSGVCVHTGSFSWCLNKGLGGIGADSPKVVRIVENAIELLLSKKSVFSAPGAAP